MSRKASPRRKRAPHDEDDRTRWCSVFHLSEITLLSKPYGGPYKPRMSPLQKSHIKNGRVLRMKPKEIRSHLNRRRNGARIVHGVQAHAKVAAKVRLRPKPPETTEAGASGETNSHAVADPALRAAENREYAGFSELSLRRELERIHRTEISACVQGWADIYSQVGTRSRYLWKWATRGAELTTLPGVAPERRVHVRDTKVPSTMICVLVDDVADSQKKHYFLTTLLNVVERPSNADL